MPYSYVASTNSGKIKRGVSDLASRDAVIQDLESRGLIVVSVDETCGCVKTCDIVCCDTQMKKKR